MFIYYICYINTGSFRSKSFVQFVQFLISQSLDFTLLQVLRR